MLILCYFNYRYVNKVVVLKIRGETFFFNVFREYDPAEPQLSVQFVNAGVSAAASHVYRRRPVYDMYVWQYTEEGTGAIDTPEGTVMLTPGMSFFIRVPGAYTYYLPQNSSNWRFTYLSFNGTDAARLYEIFRRKHGIILHHEKNSETLRFVHKFLAEIREHGMHDPYKMSLRTYEFLMTLFDETDAAGRHSSHPLADRVTKEILTHPDEMRSVAELARLCGCSRAHFTRLFHVENGIPPAQFVNDLRLRIAIHLMETELLSIKEIAARTGFARPEYFCQVFREKYLCSPGEYRKRNLPAGGK